MAFTQVPTSGFTDRSITEDKLSTGVATITATTYTLAASDADTLLAFDSPNGITVTVPANSTVAVDVGTTFRIAQIGVGTVTLSPAAGVTVDGLGAPSTVGRYAVIDLIKRATDDWLVTPTP